MPLSKPKVYKKVPPHISGVVSRPSLLSYSGAPFLEKDNHAVDPCGKTGLLELQRISSWTTRRSVDFHLEREQGTGLALA